MYNVTQAAEILDLAPSTVRRDCQLGRLTAHHDCHGWWQITKKDLAAFMKKPRKPRGNPDWRAHS